MYNKRMQKACSRRLVRLVLACFLGMGFLSPIHAGPPSLNQDLLSLPDDTGMVQATISVSTDPILCGIRKTDKTFRAVHLQPDGLVSTFRRSTQHLAASRFLPLTATYSIIARLYWVNLHGRAPPSP